MVKLHHSKGHLHSIPHNTPQLFYLTLCPLFSSYSSLFLFDTVPLSWASLNLAQAKPAFTSIDIHQPHNRQVILKQKFWGKQNTEEKLTRAKAKEKMVSQIRFIPLNEALNGPIPGPWLCIRNKSKPGQSTSVSMKTSH